MKTYRRLKSGARKSARRLLGFRKKFGYRGRESTQRLLGYKNKYKGQKAVILCNGPSLNDVDFDELKDCFCFGLNKINLMFERTSFRPSCIVAVNRLVIEQNREFFEATDLPVFMDSIAARHIAFQDNHVHLRCYENGFSRDAGQFISQGGTVTFVAMQLAYYMGFSELALVGCDHFFSQSGVPHSTLQAGESDPNHFDPNYFANQAWHAPDLEMSERAYAQALDFFEADGRVLVNASTQSALDVLPRRSLAAFLAL